jgi:hypothetical protein
MHIHWQIAGNNAQDEKDSNDEDEAAATATEKGGEKKAIPIPAMIRRATTARKRAMWKLNAGRSILN